MQTPADARAKRSRSSAAVALDTEMRERIAAKQVARPACVDPTPYFGEGVVPEAVFIARRLAQRLPRHREHRASRRGASARSSARSGDSGDDGPGEPPPATAALAAFAALLVVPLFAAGGRLNRPTQAQRVLDALRRAGERGIVTIDFLAPTIDGGAPILRLPSRIDELRQRGHVIDTVQKRPVARYVLRGDVVTSSPTTASEDVSPVNVEPEQAQLVDAEACRPPASPYDPTSPWA